MKYITVTLNPAIDQTFCIEGKMAIGELNRASSMSEISYSGKGINVSKELRRFGIDSKVLCMIGKDGGDELYNALIKADLNLFPVWYDGKVRRNVSAVDSFGQSFEINEPGDSIDFEYVIKFFALYDKVVNEREGKTVVISGSAPPGFRDDVYRQLVAGAKAAGAKVVLDADGELLKKGLEGKPDLIKPNEKELSALTGHRLDGDDEQIRLSALAAATAIYEKTGVEVLCTLGGRGSVFAGAEGSFICPAPKIEARRFKGAGDIFLARFLYERGELGKGVFDAMKRATEKCAKYLSE